MNEVINKLTIEYFVVNTDMPLHEKSMLKIRCLLKPRQTSRRSADLKKNWNNIVYDNSYLGDTG